MPEERWKKKIHIEGAKWRVNCLSISIILTRMEEQKKIKGEDQPKVWLENWLWQRFSCRNFDLSLVENSHAIWKNFLSEEKKFFRNSSCNLVLWKSPQFHSKNWSRSIKSAKRKETVSGEREFQVRHFTAPKWLVLTQILQLLWKGMHQMASKRIKCASKS